MVNLVLILVCILAGWLLRRLRILPDETHRGINIWVLYLAVPAVALKYVPTIHWGPELIVPALSPILVWIGSWLLFMLYSRIRPMSPATRTALTLVSGLGNTSFLGFPLVSAYYGEQALPIAVVCDQLCFIIMATIASVMAMNTMPDTAIGTSPAEKPNAIAVIKKLLSFPPFIGFLAALILPLFIDLSPAVPLFDKICATLAPMALFSVGMQLSFEGWREELPLLSASLAYKLLLAPLLVAAVVAGLAASGTTRQISVFEAAMAPMITAGVIATQYNLNPRLANLTVSIGILLSLVTTALWYYAMTHLPISLTDLMQ
ncbi:MAG: AEC family transporter [Bacteroidetes bacterium]|nr:AEC family transporter [Bacteroidota bacterium]